MFAIHHFRGHLSCTYNQIHTHIDTHRLYVQSWQWKNFEGDRNQHLPLHGNPTVRPVSQFSFFFLYVCVCGRQCEPSRLCHLTVGFHLVYASHLFSLTVAYMVYNAIRFCDRRRSGFLRLVSAIAVVAAFHDDDDDVGTVWPDCVKRKWKRKRVRSPCTECNITNGSESEHTTRPVDWFTTQSTLRQNGLVIIDQVAQVSLSKMACWRQFHAFKLTNTPTHTHTIPILYHLYEILVFTTGSVCVLVHYNFFFLQIQSLFKDPQM